MRKLRRHLEREIYTVNLQKTVTEVAVPIYFMEDRYDTVLRPDLAADYLFALPAPAGKHLIWFERSEHWPHIEKSEIHDEMRYFPRYPSAKPDEVLRKGRLTRGEQVVIIRLATPDVKS